MIELVQYLASEGYQLDTVIPDGKIHRFATDDKDTKNSGYYVAYRNFTHSTGEEFYVIAHGTWRDNELHTHCTLKGKTSSEDKKLIKRKIDEAQSRQAAERTRVHAITSREVEEKLAKCPTHGESDYLRKKQIAECPDLGVHFEFGGDFYVPMRDETGKMWSYQKIQWAGGKFFCPGGRISGCFHVLGSLESSERVFIAEGLATAASIRIATGMPTVCAFNSGNLPKVAERLRATYPDKEFVVCGDDDLWTKRPDGEPHNPGREKAEEAAKACLGRTAFPVFQNLEGNPTDFNDLHVREGLDAVRAQLLNVDTKKQYVRALGFKEREYFFTSSGNRQITPLSTFSQVELMKLMPLSYWESLFPGAGGARVDWTEAQSQLMVEARAKGIFQSRHIRGAGVWNDEGRVVVNMGDHLLVDGDRCELGSIQSRYFYTLGNALAPLHAQPLSADECTVLVQACDTFRWVKKDFSFLMAGALVVSRVCGALPIRPHTWITGSAQTGKSTLIEQLIKPILGDSTLYVHGATSEAGIRQSLGADAISILFDEFETTSIKSGENVNAVVELLRAAWSDSSAMLIKGGASGNATAYQVRCSAIVSSIRTRLTNDADRSRFAIIELAPHGSDQEHWKHLSALLAQIDKEYGERLFSRTIRMIPILLANYRTLKRALATKVSQRFGDQYGMLFAGYSLLIQDEALTDEEADRLVSFVQLSEEKEEAKVADHDDALTLIQTKKIRFERDNKFFEMTVAEMVLQTPFDRLVDEALQRIGIKVASEFVSISNNHSELESQIFKGSRWSNAWATSLARIPGAKKNQVVWLAGKSQRCLSLPIAIVAQKS